MQRTIHSLALGAALLASAVMGHAASDPAPQEQKLYKIAEIRGEQQVQNFEHDVQVMQAERQNVLNLQAQVDREKNASKKKDLQTKLDAALKKLNEDNAALTKAYGFSIVRDYTLKVDALSVYLHLTDEEAAKIAKEAAAQQAQKSKK